MFFHRQLGQNIPVAVGARQIAQVTVDEAERIATLTLLSFLLRRLGLPALGAIFLQFIIFVLLLLVTRQACSKSGFAVLAKRAN